MRIISRREWGATKAAGQGSVALPVAEVWLHHSVTNVDVGVFAPADDTPEQERRAMRQLEAIGESRFGAGVSYTFAVMPSGRVYEGTGAGRLGTHTGGRNSRSHAIVLIGNYEENEPTDNQLRSVADLLRYGRDRGWWRNARLNGGHRDLKQTACPGIKAYRKIATINELAAGVQATALPEEGILNNPEAVKLLQSADWNARLTNAQIEVAAIFNAHGQPLATENEHAAARLRRIAIEVVNGKRTIDSVERSVAAFPPLQR